MRYLPHIASGRASGALSVDDLDRVGSEGRYWAIEWFGFTIFVAMLGRAKCPPQPTRNEGGGR